MTVSTDVSRHLDLERRIVELERRVQSLAEQNTHLARDLALARERQAAAADILGTIAAGSGDDAQALRQIADTTVRLFRASSVTLRILGNPADDDPWSRTLAVGPGGERIASAVANSNLKVGGRNFPGTVVAENRQIHMPDVFNVDPAYADFPGLRHARAAGTLVMAGTPLRRNGVAIGALIVHRDRAEPFTEDELALQQSFADQAVIAIENARLFNETRNALDRQTATAEILKVIASSPSDTRPVFDALVLTAVRLLGCDRGFVQLCDDRHFWSVAWCGPDGPLPRLNTSPVPIDPAANFPSRAILSKATLHLPDWSKIALPPFERNIREQLGLNSSLYMPLLRDGACIGLFALAGKRANIFSEADVALAESFRDQAAIAIENARLFNETREALERQTATAEILKVIASSPSDVQPVFAAIAASSNQLLGGFSTAVFRFMDETAHLAAFTPTTPAADEVLRRAFPQPVVEFAPFTMARQGQSIQIPDTEIHPELGIRHIARARGFRSMLFTPLMSQGTPIGLISVTRTEPGAFAEQHVQLMRTFADQAVIAIENARLFEEVQQRTRDLSEALQQQTATADVLKVISRSAFDLNNVMTALADSAALLCSADISGLFLCERGHLVLGGVAAGNTEVTAFLRQNPIPISEESYSGRAVLTGTIMNIGHVEQDHSSAVLQRFRDKIGYEALLLVPLMRDRQAIGLFALTRNRIGEFSKREVELVQTFADQAVIAIENARLFDEVQTRTRELAQSLDELRAAQDRLVQTEKLASLGQLTAGIAHEIKNPLNFVNNFAALSTELSDELNDVLTPVPLDPPIREEVDELTGMLKDNLRKIVQHGQRADSIVKNMLLHSREGSGEHRPTDINALVEESLNLAYHGARAEKPQFNVTIERELDPAAGTVEAFPQEITRVLLNLISNGFYAVSKRKAETGEAGFEPIVRATTRGRSGHVEIRIRDNGTGIPPEVKDKMFNPFFTTKPAGEGTGLGLSMSHDIVVKQHGGTIDVETRPGEYTEFTISLPRTSNLADKTRG